jgi:hypothetical protein
MNDTTIVIMCLSCVVCALCIIIMWLFNHLEENREVLRKMQVEREDMLSALAESFAKAGSWTQALHKKKARHGNRENPKNDDDF